MSSKSRKLIDKQKRLIATRLMQISLLVDDYVYKQSPILQNSCEAYIREISSYKSKCYGDVRSLQVIEKLTRCLKGIIEEQQELDECDGKAEYFQGASNKDNSIELSPVYSTADEGLTQSLVTDNTVCVVQTHEEMNCYTDCIQNNNHAGSGETKDPLTDTGVRGHHDENQLVVVDLCDDETQVIDLRNDEIEDLINQNRQNSAVTFEFNIDSAISSLSIKDIENAYMATPFSQECSQSILGNFGQWSNITSQAGLEASLTQDYENVIKVASIRRNVDNDIAYKNKQINTVSLSHRALLNHTRTVQNTNVPKISHTEIKPLTKKKNKRIEPTFNSESDTKSTNKKNTAVKRTNKKLKVPIKNIKANAKKNKQVTQPKPVHPIHDFSITTKPIMESNQATYNTSNITYGQNMSNSTHITTTTNDLKNNKTFDTNLPQVYNKNIVDDLSWMENIRFVREVSAEEYVSFTTDQDFWANYTLPDCCSEADFN